MTQRTVSDLKAQITLLVNPSAPTDSVSAAAVHELLQDLVDSSVSQERAGGYRVADAASISTPFTFPAGVDTPMPNDALAGKMLNRPSTSALDFNSSTNTFVGLIEGMQYLLEYTLQGQTSSANKMVLIQMREAGGGENDLQIHQDQPPHIDFAFIQNVLIFTATVDAATFGTQLIITPEVDVFAKDIVFNFSAIATSTF